MGETCHIPGERIRLALERSKVKGLNSSQPTIRISSGYIQSASRLESAANATLRRRASSNTVRQPTWMGECDKVVEKIMGTLRAASRDLAIAYEWPSHDNASSTILDSLKTELESALSDFQRGLALLLEGESGREAKIKDHFRLAFFMTALLDLAKEVLILVGLVMDISKHNGDGKRWRISGFHLLGISEGRQGSTASGDAGELGVIATG